MSLWLARDQHSNEVVALQNALNTSLKPATPLVLDGIFGPLTEALVQEFQKSQGITADGIAGPHTLCALFEGAEVTARIHVSTTGGTREAATPPVAGSQGSARPRRPSARPSYDLSRANFPGWVERDSTLQAWILGQTPKKQCPVIRPAPPSKKNLPIEILDPLGRYRLSTLLFNRKRLALNAKQTSALATILPHQMFDLEFSLEGENRGLKEFEIDFSFKVLLIRLSPWIVPSLSFFRTPDAHWGGKVQVTLLKRSLVEWEWGQIKGSIDPRFIATVAMPPFFNRRPESSFFTGVGVELMRELGPDGYRLSFGPEIGFLFGNGEKVEGAFAPVPLLIGAKMSLLFGPILNRQ